MDGHHMCLRINTEPTLQPLIYGTKTLLQRFIYGARCALKGRKVYSIWPIQNIVVTKKYLKLHLARHICISHNTYRVILFTSLPYSIIRKTKYEIQLQRISIHNYVMTLKFYTTYAKFYSKS